jgi:hypothetical protein
MNADRIKKTGKGMRSRQSIGVRPGTRQKNGYVHVISPATASEIRRTLRIKSTQIANILRAFDAAGVKV